MEGLWEAVTSAGFLATAVVLCLHSRFLWKAGRDLTDLTDELEKVLLRLGRADASPPRGENKPFVDAAPDPGPPSHGDDE